MATHEISIDCYVGQSREWLLQRREKLNAQILKHGPGAVASTSDGGISVSYRTVLAADELRAINYALAGRAKEDLAGGDAAVSHGRAPGGYVPASFF